MTTPNPNDTENTTPQDAQEGPSPVDSTQVDPQAVAVAVSPTEGQLFEFGGKTFHLTYLSIAGQNKLDKILAPWMTSGVSGLSPLELRDAIQDSLIPAAALILSEQDPEVTVDWIGGLKGKGIRDRLFELVMLQIGLDEVGKFYAVLSHTAGKLYRTTQAALGRTTPTT